MLKKTAVLSTCLALLALAGCAYSPMIPTPIGPNGLSIAEQSTYVANGGAVGGADQ